MISVLIPTRGRREGLARAIVSARQTAADPNDLEFIVYVDEDDQATYDLFPEKNIKFIVGKRIVLSNYWNKCAALSSGDILHQSNDDVVYQTRGWDMLVEKEFAKVPDKILMVHGDDGSGRTRQSGRGEFATHPFVSRRWYETLGYVTPPCFSSDFGDTWLNALANAIQRRISLPFTVEHRHYLFGKAPLDTTTEERLARHHNDRVWELYEDLAPLRTIDIEKLRSAIA